MVDSTFLSLLSRVWRKVRVWVNLATAFVLCAILYAKLKNDPSLLSFHLVRPFYLIPAIGCICLGYLFSTWMWRILLPVQGRLSFFELLGIFVKSMFLNNILPTGVAGDVVRILSLSVETRRVDMAISSAIMSRLVSLWVVMMISFVSAMMYFQGNLEQAALLVGGTGAALLFTLLGTLLLFRVDFSTFLPKKASRWVQVLTNLRVFYRQPVILGKAALCALAIQLLSIIINYSVGRALLFPIHFGQLFFAMPLVNLITVLPLSYGGFGIREGSYYLLLGKAGVVAFQAVQLSLSVYFLILITTGIAAGIAGLLDLTVRKNHRNAPDEENNEENENSHIQLA